MEIWKSVIKVGKEIIEKDKDNDPEKEILQILEENKILHEKKKSKEIKSIPIGLQRILNDPEVLSISLNKVPVRPQTVKGEVSFCKEVTATQQE